MREVKFRGKDCFGNWQFGSLVTDNKTYWFIRNSVCDVSVDSKTAGQYTGLKDKNGVEIYEGDGYDIGEEIGCVDFKNGSFIWTGNGYPISHKKIEYIEIIGNIHDNPEFLK